MERKIEPLQMLIGLTENINMIHPQADLYASHRDAIIAFRGFPMRLSHRRY